MPPAHRALPRGYWFAYAAAWLAVAAAYTTIFVIQGTSAARASLDVLNNTGSAATLGWVVVWWTGWMSRHPRGRLVTGLQMVLAAALFSLIWLYAIGIGFTVQGALMRGTWEWSPLTGAAVPWQLFAGLMVFAAVAGSGFAARGWHAFRVEAERAAQAEALRVRAQLESLRARLHPHFLFNTLHSVRAQVHYDADAAANALDEFADLLRYALRVNRDGVAEATLAEEWSQCERYLGLERMRLEERLRVQAELAPDTLSCRVPTFLLQPLLENAVRHAVAPRREGGTVRVRSWLADDNLYVLVADDGPGADAGEVTASSGLGLRSVRDRLAVLYQDRASFTFVTRPGEGFEVRLGIPTDFDTAELAIPSGAEARIGA